MDLLREVGLRHPTNSSQSDPSASVIATHTTPILGHRSPLHRIKGASNLEGGYLVDRMTTYVLEYLKAMLTIKFNTWFQDA